MGIDVDTRQTIIQIAFENNPNLNPVSMFIADCQRSVIVGLTSSITGL